MAAERIADMTRAELEEMVIRIVDQRVQQRYRGNDTRTVQEINESIRRHRRTPKPGTPSTLELLREDRDR
jgi:hypothetical protein